MRQHITFAMAALTATLLVSASTAFAAPLQNGGFETGDYTGWTTAGNAIVQNSSLGVGPASGTWQAFLTTGPAVSTGNPVGPVAASTLETFSGLNAGTLSSYTTGSAIKQSGVTINHNDFVSFAYDVLTQEVAGQFGEPDITIAFIPSGGTLGTTLLSINALNVTSAAPPTVPPFTNSTGYTNFAQQFTGASGTYDIVFLVANSQALLPGDEFGATALALDNVAISATNPYGGGGVTVPLPLAALAAPLGLGFAGFAARRIRKTA